MLQCTMGALSFIAYNDLADVSSAPSGEDYQNLGRTRDSFLVGGLRGIRGAHATAAGRHSGGQRGAPTDDDHGLVYVVEVCHDLAAGAWIPAVAGTDMVFHGVVETGDGITEAVRYIVLPPESEKTVFLRLRVSLVDE